jgi:predicted transcriptional regulator
MEVTLRLDDALVQKLTKIADERSVKVEEFVRACLENVVAENARLRQEQLERLQRSFEKMQFRVGKKTWTRADLYDRNS